LEVVYPDMDSLKQGLLAIDYSFYERCNLCLLRNRYPWIS
jgi:hypothetical protein